MPLREIKKTIAETSDMINEWSAAYGIQFRRSMNVTGGEPFLRHDLFEILREIKKHEFTVFLLTNGTLLDPARARMLADIGVDGVQVSIEGRERVHDSIRGPGSFRAAAFGIDCLAGSGLNVNLNITLSSLNAGQISDIIDFGSDLGVNRIGFSRLVPSGKGRDLISCVLPKDRLKDLYGTLLSLEHESPEIVTGDPLAGSMRDPSGNDEGNIAISGCAAGVSGLTIGSNGDVLPCRRLPLSIGNVRNDSLRELWATSPILEALRDRSRYRGKCGACPRWAVCRGCRAIAYAWDRAKGGDNYVADDPQCFV